MNRLTLILILICLLPGPVLHAQDPGGPLTLEACIALALEHNLDLQSAQLQTRSSEVDYRVSLNQLLPSVNGDYNLGVNDGRSIDPFTNDYIDEKLTFSNAALNLDAVVFNGFRLINTLKQNRLNLKAAELELEAARQALVLDVTLAFLQTVNARELVRLTAGRLEATTGQMDRLRAMFEQQTGNPAEYRDLQGQHANDRAALIQAQTDLNAAVLALEQVLNAGTDIDPEQLVLLLDFESYGYSADEVVAQAMAELDAIEARRLRVDAARKGVAAARAQYVPQFSFFAGINTNYSSAARLFEETGSSIQETGDFVNVSGQDYPVLTEQTSFNPVEISYADQFDNNLSTAYGLSVRIPLFNGFRAKNNVARQKIQKQEAEVALERSELQFRQAIRQAHTAMEAALERYQVLEEQVEAYAESFRINEIRFNNGISNSTEYIVSKNNMDNARINLANAQYEYLLRVRVLEYYRGNALAEL